jgi:hypothetical protein
LKRPNAVSTLDERITDRSSKVIIAEAQTCNLDSAQCRQKAPIDAKRLSWVENPVIKAGEIISTDYEDHQRTGADRAERPPDSIRPRKKADIADECRPSASSCAHRNLGSQIDKLRNEVDAKKESASASAWSASWTDLKIAGRADNCSPRTAIASCLIAGAMSSRPAWAPKRSATSWPSIDLER